MFCDLWLRYIKETALNGEGGNPRISHSSEDLRFNSSEAKFLVPDWGIGGISEAESKEKPGVWDPMPALTIT
jgi:hypothetical protein